jgi:hypothetical protein
VTRLVFGFPFCDTPFPSVFFFFLSGAADVRAFRRASASPCADRGKTFAVRFAAAGFCLFLAGATDLRAVADAVAVLAPLLPFSVRFAAAGFCFFMAGATDVRAFAVLAPLLPFGFASLTALAELGLFAATFTFN